MCDHGVDGAEWYWHWYCGVETHTIPTYKILVVTITKLWNINKPCGTALSHGTYVTTTIIIIMVRVYNFAFIQQNNGSKYRFPPLFKEVLQNDDYLEMQPFQAEYPYFQGLNKVWTVTLLSI